MEGENYGQPAFLRVGEDEGAWKSLAGLTGNGSLHWMGRGPLFVGCGGEHSGVYEAKTGNAIWSAKTRLCPIWWDG